MTTVHQVLLPGEADGGDSPRLSITDDTYHLLANTSRRHTLVGANNESAMPRTENIEERCVVTNEINTQKSEESSPREQTAETSSQQAQSSPDGIIGTDRNANMHRTTTAGTKTRIPSETGSESFHNSGHNGIRLDIKSNCDEKPILAEADYKDSKTRKNSPLIGSNIARTVGKLAACFLCGIIFGIAAEKGRVFETATIRGQFIYQRWIMMKMFLSAAATSCFCLALLSVIPLTKNVFESSRTAYVAGLTHKGIISVTIGGAILGAAMVLSGSCPGMVLVQIGAWLSNGGGAMTFFGCMVGVYLYALVEPWTRKMMSPTKPYDKYLADSYTEKWKVPFFAIALAAGVLMGLAVVTIEILVPWTTDLVNPNVEGSWFFETLAWPPYVSGVMIGCLQIPLVLIVSDTIGGSSSFCTLGAQALVTERMESWSPYLAKFKRGAENWWQVFYVIGAIAGACISAAASGSLGSTPGVSLMSSFLGGVLLIFGSRLAGGCTSGHGLSGMGVLSVLSFVTVAAMFAGGTAFGFIFWAVSNASKWDYYTF
eukprot:XP_011680683.1 PREDICTED: uncharacterized protein LOC591506 [Strongylocentrotus purpuratus]